MPIITNVQLPTGALTTSAVPSTTTVNGQLALRAALFNHRTTTDHLDALIDATLALGRAAAEPIRKAS